MRRKLKSRRIVSPDFQYGSVKVGKLVNYIMHNGKKNAARKIVYDAFVAIKEKTKQEPLVVFEEALKNVGPLMEIRSRRIGGANYQVPQEVKPERRLALAFRWLLESARGKKGEAMAAKLATELIAASKNEGDAIKKRENVHKMAEANRAFAHFAIRRQTN